ncbi:MAG: transposase [Bacteroidetes bacterium]|nr:transposase [Bacteroidota bacterium]
MLDAPNIKGRQVLICVGITETGEQRMSGFVELVSENVKAAAGLLERLVGRGLRHAQGLLCVMDRIKGLRKAFRQVFGAYAQMQRCIWHKRENVVGKLQRKTDQQPLRQQLNEAYNQDTYDEAKAALMSICEELQTEGQHQGPEA